MEELEGFEQFWSIYPRKVGKLAAKKMYKRGLKITTSAEIIRAAKLYADERKGKEPQFTKHPATWLNSGCWEDYPEPKMADITQFYASFSSEELDAWDHYLRSTTGKNAPRDRKGGWWFESQWPPAAELQKVG